MSMVLALAFVTVLGAGGFGRPPAPSWQVLDTGTTARLRGLAAVSDRVAWASGTGGTVLRTVDGGRTWQQVGPPGTTDLQFRDIEAFDAWHAVVLSIGEGEASRVYVTDDGGRTWTETFRNADPAAFYDCVAFLDRRHGLALSDPVGGKFRILATHDGGRHWAVQPTDGMPDALAGEFAFAASGTCLVASKGDAWFATGGGAQARVFHSADGGGRWSVTASPIPSGEAAGIFSLAFQDRRRGLAVGGDFLVPAEAPDGAATTRDGGRTWTVAKTVPGEYRSGAAWRGAHGDTAYAVGPTGSDVTYDGGRTWHRFDTGSFDSVQCAGGACWASGEAGRIGRLR
ncbi:oxidoreductase [Dactylosporangium sp. AC04546]|uniref:WD40/YVTN/BNR-like repeat-containing protein n=1 Tax=Dactylosporangium sp. AC04546 TaxID=2862460 RepID=UPI002E7AAF5A|nr:oxidoreductase [Dactylosporangium sp. AC04546]WVK82921.1 oxidoreductase [Dactylosporangium sp. AC04546]